MIVKALSNAPVFDLTSKESLLTLREHLQSLDLLLQTNSIPFDIK